MSKKNERIVGIFRATEKGFGFVELEDEDLDDVFIPPNSVGNALNGDTVQISIFKPKQGSRKAEAKITKILKRDRTEVVGIFQKSKNFGFVVPDDKSFNTDIFVNKKKIKEAKNDDKVLVKIIKYPERGKNAEGEIMEILGNVNDAGVDFMSIVKEYNLLNEFPPNVLGEVKLLDGTISKEEEKSRLDLTDRICFTIDGEDAKDLDDAVFVSKNNDGTFNLDVHIADVSHYVREGTAIDKEAIIRGTSVYMLNKVIPMLPVELSNGICSLNAGEKRLALSCLMKINDKGEVIESDVQKTIIKVTERMTYTNVNKILNNLDEEVLDRYKDYIDNFKAMEELALILKERRLKNGYLNLDIPESKLELDETGKCIDVHKYELSFANEIIEQFMLTANETVAEKFYWLEAPFIYRVHEEPDYDKIKDTNKFLFNIGYRIKAVKDNIRPKAFSDVLDSIKGTEYEKVISTLILRTLKVARYESENRGHFGIASKYYCHFTSPIRRYPDLFIHRVISEYIENNYMLKEERLEDLGKKAEKYADSSSEREREAVKAERDSIDLKKAEFMEDKIGCIYDGIVSSVTGFGIFVELDNTVEGIVRFENMGDEYFRYDDMNKVLIGEKTKLTYKIGDKVRVRVIEANKQLRKVAFEIVFNEDNEDKIENENEEIEE